MSIACICQHKCMSDGAVITDPHGIFNRIGSFTASWRRRKGPYSAWLVSLYCAFGLGRCNPNGAANAITAWQCNALPRCNRAAPARPPAHLPATGNLRFSLAATLPSPPLPHDILQPSSAT